MLKTQKSAILVKVATASALLLSAVGAVLYGIAYVNSYDPALRHFGADCAAVKVAFALFALAAALSAVCALALRGGLTLRPEDKSSSGSFVLWLTAFMFIGFTVASLLSGENVMSVSPFGSYCIKAIPVLSVLSALPFFCAAARRLSGSVLHSITAIAPVLWAAAVMFKYYFDLHEVPLNDPELTLTIVSLSAAILFFLTEWREALSIARPASSALSQLLCVCLAGPVSAARIVLYFILENGILIPTLMECIMLFTVAALALYRLLSVPSRLAPEPESAVEGEAEAEAEAEPEVSENTADAANEDL